MSGAANEMDIRVVDCCFGVAAAFSLLRVSLSCLFIVSTVHSIISQYHQLDMLSAGKRHAALLLFTKYIVIVRDDLMLLA